MNDMSLLVWIVVALSLNSATAAGDCPGAYRNMTMEAACREATAAGEPAMPTYQTCVDTVGEDSRAGSVHEAIEYAYNAASRAVLVYTGAESWAELLLKNASALSGEEKAAYELCNRGYQEADAAMVRVWRKVDRIWSRLPEPCGVGLGNEYRTALRGVGACRDRVVRLPSSPMVDMVKRDNDVTLVAYVLGKLVGAK
ncbi:unnamed protein product [Urochloa decumbens]|uniref:Pectinesterase inhibitor domain-containing protein n=1 Tax=Urochloa decumbens TaxID=240449 RepID=A0ABC9HEP1_9POAL